MRNIAVLERAAVTALAVADQSSSPSAWRAVRDEVHPWHRDVSIHAFKTGLGNAAQALKNFSSSRAGTRKGPVGFIKRKTRHSRQSIGFVELNVDHRHWIRPDSRAHVRLMLPRRADEGTWERRHTRAKSAQKKGRDRRGELAWLHTPPAGCGR